MASIGILRPLARPDLIESRVRLACLFRQQITNKLLNLPRVEKGLNRPRCLPKIVVRVECMAKSDDTNTRRGCRGDSNLGILKHKR